MHASVDLCSFFLDVVYYNVFVVGSMRRKQWPYLGDLPAGR